MQLIFDHLLDALPVVTRISPESIRLCVSAHWVGKEHIAKSPTSEVVLGHQRNAEHHDRVSQHLLFILVFFFPLMKSLFARPAFGAHQQPVTGKSVTRLAQRHQVCRVGLHTAQMMEVMRPNRTLVSVLCRDPSLG